MYIYLTTSDNRVAIDQSAFLDMLLKHPDLQKQYAELQKQYAELKKQLAEQYPDNRTMYRTKKGMFIEKCLEDGYDVQSD